MCFTYCVFSHSATETIFDGPKSWKIVGKGKHDLAGGFKDFYFHPYFGEDSQFD